MTDDNPTPAISGPKRIPPRHGAAAEVPAQAPAETQAATRVDTHDASPPTATTASPAPRRDAQAGNDAVRLPLIAVAVLAVLCLIGGYFLWQHGSANGRLAARIGTLENRVSQLEARPAPPDLHPLEQRVAALEARPVPDLKPIEQHVSALEARPVPDLQPLQQRLTALENKPNTLDPAAQKQLADMSGRIDGIAARQDQLGTQAQSDLTKLTGQIGGLQQTVAGAVKDNGTLASQAQKASSDVAALTSREARTSSLQGAAAALQAGRPLGSIPNAPPALAKFADTAPPTEASLRLSFGEAAAATRSAGQPAPADASFLSRMWDRAQSGVVVRDNGRVLVGDAVSGILEQARHRLDAGDLAGAVSALDGLTGPAKAAMASWRGKAQSLLDARAALANAANG